MKIVNKLLKVIILSLALPLSTFGQTEFTYFLPNKSFKINVTFTEVSKKKVSKSNSKECTKVIDCETYVVIKDPITVEEIVLPDINIPLQFSIPNLGKSGASFDYTFKRTENGVIASFNSSREPAGVAIISGTVGFISNLITTVVGALYPKKVTAGEIEYEEIIVERKIQLSSIIEIKDCNSNIATKIELPNFYQFYADAPKVNVLLNKISSYANGNTSGSGEIVIKSRIPAIFSLKVNVTNMLNLPDQIVINSLVTIPQCGVLAEHKFDLKKGKRTVSFEINPTSGMLTSIGYKKESNFKASQENIKNAMDQLNAAISKVNEYKENKQFQAIDLEIANLKKENEKLQELKNKLELEKALSKN